MPNKKLTIDMCDKGALINIINAMFKDGIPDIVIYAARLDTINRQLNKINVSLRKKTEKIKGMRGKKRADIINKGTNQYYMFNRLVKEREELLIILKGTVFDPYRDDHGTNNNAIEPEGA